MATAPPEAARARPDPEVADIVSRAATLKERLGSGYRPAGDANFDRELAHRRLVAWREAFARGDEAVFLQRLHADGLSLPRVLPVLGSMGSFPDLPLPSWVDAFLLARNLAATGAATGERFLDDDQVPFEEICSPFVVAGRQLLAARRQCDSHLVNREAAADLERLLLRRLSTLSARALHVELVIELAALTSPVERLAARDPASFKRTRYDSFVRSVLGDGWMAFFGRYPVLARLMSRATELWVDATAELVGRLRNDRPDLDAAFGGGRRLGPVAAARPGLSDPHRGGRTVAALTFASGATVAYKPKDVGTEQAFNRLLTWLNAKQAPLPFRTVKTLVRSGYGWAEWVEHEPCRDDGEVRDYYRRAGILACLVFALCGTDCHRENLIACGPHPVLVDTESLMHHRAQTHGRVTGVQQAALDELVNGVLGTGLLPNWERSEIDSGVPRDVSALHTAEERELEFHTARWEAVNRDGMILRTGPTVIALPRSQPVLPDRVVRLDDHTAELMEGFERCYRFLVDHRPELVAVGGPLQSLARQNVRFIYRNTRVYGALHDQLCDPHFLKDGVDRSIQLETLGRALAAADSDAERERWWPVFDAERSAMEDLDVPLFGARADADQLVVGPGTVVDGCLAAPSVTTVMDRIEGLGNADLHRQLSFMAGSLHSNSAHHDGFQPVHRTIEEVSQGRPEGSVLDEAATAIAAEIAERALMSEDRREATWIAPQYLPRLERYQLQPIAHDLHSGACGVSLFLAALARLTADDYHRELALAAIAPLRRTILQHGASLGASLGHGSATGIGSVVYGLTCVGRLLSAPALYADARALAACLSRDAVAGAPLDVFSGIAGDILGLLAVHRATGDAASLETAIACGQRLLATARPGPKAGAAWPTLGGRQLTGFSHGAAGIAYALLRLYRETTDRSFRTAAADAIAHETSLLDASEGNWPDLRDDDQPAFKRQWCHGAPGIGLARIGGLDQLDTPDVRRDIEVAVSTTLATGPAGPDHLCCGNLGRAEVLLAAGRRLDQDHLVDAAVQGAGDVLRRAGSQGTFHLHSSLPGRVHMPGLFMGMSGIGYQLLRIAHPDDLPSVLLWD